MALTYVLRQVHAPDQLALADEATLVSLAKAVIEQTVVYGEYLLWSDPDARGGWGDERWTDDVTKAKRFPTFQAAMACWKEQSKVRPLRNDGRPNRPLTAFSVTPERVE